MNSLVPGAEVVKGFNTLSAWALQNGPLVFMCVYLFPASGPFCRVQADRVLNPLTTSAPGTRLLRNITL